MAFRSLAFLVLIAGLSGCGRPQAEDPLIVFAASSLQTVFDELAPMAAAELGQQVVPSYGASSAMARQIEQGAPAAVFISADLAWMDYLDDRSLIERDTRVNLLTNELVIVAPQGVVVTLDLADATSWTAALGDGRLAVADPAGVPAGRYAKEALTSLNVWAVLESRLAPAENVRSTLQLVARREAPLGIVYRTDALAEPRVTQVAVFPPSAHTPIVYPAAVVRGAAPVARRLIAFLRGEQARTIFTKHGFGVTE